MTLDGVVLRGIFEHKRLKPTVVRAKQGNINNLAELKQVMNTELKLEQLSPHFNRISLLSGQDIIVLVSIVQPCR